MNGQQHDDQVILSLANDFPKCLNLGGRWELRVRKERDDPRGIRIALDDRSDHPVDHIVDLGFGEEVTDGDKRGLGQQGVSEVDVRDDQKAPESLHSRHDLPIAPFGQRGEDRTPTDAEKCRIQQPRSMHRRNLGDAAGRTEDDLLHRGVHRAPDWSDRPIAERPPVGVSSLRLSPLMVPASTDRNLVFRAPACN